MQIAPKPKFTYFFFGGCTEDVLSSYIAKAENMGCEFLQLVPGMMQVRPGGLVAGNGKPVSVIIYNVFVRCAEEAYEGIKKQMQIEVEKEKQEGLRHGIK